MQNVEKTTQGTAALLEHERIERIMDNIEKIVENTEKTSQGTAVLLEPTRVERIMVNLAAVKK